MVSEKKNFYFFFENLPLMPPWQPIKLNNLDKIRMKRCGVLNIHIFEKVKGLTALKEKSLKILRTDGRTTDGRRIPSDTMS